MYMVHIHCQKENRFVTDHIEPMKAYTKRLIQESETVPSFHFFLLYKVLHSSNVDIVHPFELPPPTLRLEVGDSGLGPDSLSWFPIQCKQDVSRFIGRVPRPPRAWFRAVPALHCFCFRQMAARIRSASSRMLRLAFSSRWCTFPHCGQVQIVRRFSLTDGYRYPQS